VETKVVVVGGGYVGLPLAISAQLAGYEVEILDVDPVRVDEINSGIRPSGFPDCSVSATVNPCCQREADVVVICVPTPTDIAGVPDLSFLHSAVESFLGSSPKSSCLLSIESTVYPGYTMGLWSSVQGKALLSFSSERINPGTPFHELSTIPKVVGGANEKSLQAATEFYSRLFRTVVPVSSPSVAEMSKLLENSFRAANIALVNEFSRICGVFDVDIGEVIEAASTKPFGFMPFHPGPGVGGHCIPVDPLYLVWAVQNRGEDMPFLRSAMKVNREMPHFVVSRARDIVPFGDVLVIGVSYKEEVPDTRESPALLIIAALHDAGYRVSYYDPFVPRLEEADMESSNLERRFDLGILVTKHSSLNMSQVMSSCSVVLDTRRVLALDGDEKVVRL
jgi:UDP-N-acetyl-D-glucosamine dehydrogenase